MQKQILKITFLILLFSTFLDAKTMFWEVNGTHGGKVFLLGSIHVGDEDMYPLDSKIYDAFSTANYLMLEVKKDEKTESLLNAIMYKKGRLDANDTLQNHLSQSTYTDVVAWANELHLPMTRLEHLKPWVVAVTLSMYDITRLGYSPAFGVDEHFEQKAVQLSKPIYGLESIQSQMDIFTDDNVTYQEDLLRSMLDSRLKSSEVVEDFFRQWKEGNVTYFEKEIIAPFDAYPEIKARLLSERNEQMFQRVLRYVKNKKGRNYFVIVGLAHLLGEEGILKKLEAEGIAFINY